MDATGPRDVAKQQYANVRRSLTDFEERVVARYWDEDTLARASFEWLLGSLDLFAGWFLADDEIARRGQDLMRQTSYPAGHREAEPDQPAVKASLVDITFTLPADVEADTVALCGEFNQWSVGDIQLERDRDGVWRAVVALEPGRSYRYRYLLDGERWENASDAGQYVANPFGSVDSVISVAPS